MGTINTKPSKSNRQLLADITSQVTIHNYLVELEEGIGGGYGILRQGDKDPHHGSPATAPAPATCTAFPNSRPTIHFKTPTCTVCLKVNSL